MSVVKITMGLAGDGTRCYELHSPVKISSRHVTEGKCISVLVSVGVSIDLTDSKVSY